MAKLTNGWMKVALTSSRSLSPATDQIWLARKPTVQPGILFESDDGGSNAPLLRADQVIRGGRQDTRAQCPRSVRAAVGFGRKSRLRTVSPIPAWSLSPSGKVGRTLFWTITGTMVREIMFQFALSPIGMTGSHVELILSAIVSSGPIPQS